MISLIGQSLGRYHILEQLGEGGMATVYKAYDTRLETNVAVKVIRTENLPQSGVERALKRFEREAKSLAKLTHPNIIPIIDYGEYAGSPYLVMKYLPGGTLKQLLKGTPIPWQEAAHLLLPVSRALDFAHRQGMIHRDVKPSNILITQDGEPMLTDFGIAKIIDEEATVDLTGTNATVGTPEYMAPEQVISKTVDQRADIYALGIVFFEMVTGRRPFQADTPMAVLFKQASEPLPRPKEFVPNLPERVEQVFIKSLAKKPEDRYQKMGELAAALENLTVTLTEPPLVATVRPSKVLDVPPYSKSNSKASSEGFSSLPPSDQISEPPAYPPMAKSNNHRYWWTGLGLIGLFGLVALIIIAGRLIGSISAPDRLIPTSTQQSIPENTQPALIPVLLPTGTMPPAAIESLIPTATQPSLASTEQQSAQTGPILIKWSIGVGTGADPAQVSIENEVAADFNKAQDKIHLIIEVIPNASARDTISTEIAAGAGPDIVGPIGWIGSNAFGGQWLDIAPYLKSTNYDTTKFEPALTAMYQTDQGTVGLPFAVYPSAIYFNTGLFTEAGLNPLPAKYGDQYKMADGTMVDWTWENLTKVAKLLTIDAAGKHSGEAGFDATKAVQYGFSFAWEGHPNYWGAFQSNGGAMLVPGGAKGSYKAQIPAGWKTAWQWVYDGIWGAEPYIPNGAVAGGADFDAGNVFASGKVAMIDSPSWYTCCVGDLTKAGGKFDFGTMPMGADGKVAGRVDADTIRIWKGTKHPAEAFTVMTYLIDTGIQKLVVGSPTRAPAYGAVPSQTALRGPWVATEKANFPFVKNWGTLLSGLNYPDIPTAEGYMPNINEAWARIQSFGDLIINNRVNLAAQEAMMETDLKTIFNK